MYQIPKLPQQAMEVLQVVAAGGGRAYLVGGALRDLLLGLAPQDWDFAATLPPERLLELFPEGQLIGGSCGTVRVPFGGSYCEITPCRAEDDYRDGRHPEQVVFMPDILADLARRDFTVNAMACDGEALFDPFGGQVDLQQHVLRCVGDAAQRFEEDALRILRLFRLEAQLGFSAEEKTAVAARNAVAKLAVLPRERVLQEVLRILLSARPWVLGTLIAWGGLRDYGFVFAPALRELARVPGLPAPHWYRLWAWITLCGADMRQVGEAFGFSRRMQDTLAECTRLFALGPARDMLDLKQKLSRSKLDYTPVAATFAAVSPAFASEPALFAKLRASKQPYQMRHLAVNGDILREEGIKGAQCGKILHELLQAVIKNPALNKTPVLLGLARGLKKLLN